MIKRLTFLLCFFILFLNNAVFAEQSYTESQAKEILLDPKLLVQASFVIAVEKFEKDHSQILLCDVVDKFTVQLFSIIKDDQLLVRKIYDMYEGIKIDGFLYEKTDISQWIAHIIKKNALSAMTPGDDAFFKAIYDDKDSPFRSIAFCKINDFEYVKQAILEESKTIGKEDENTYTSGPASSFLRCRGAELYKAEPKFVDSLARSAINKFIFSEAIKLTTNQELLNQIANSKSPLYTCDKIHYPVKDKVISDICKSRFHSAQDLALRRLDQLN